MINGRCRLGNEEQDARKRESFNLNRKTPTKLYLFIKKTFNDFRVLTFPNGTSLDNQFMDSEEN